MAGPQKFWMVWNSSGRRPCKRHPTHESALAEALRLGGVSPGAKLDILEATGYASTGEALPGGEFGTVKIVDFPKAKRTLAATE